MRNTKNKMLKHALRYAKKGWPVLPLYGIDDGICGCGDLNCNSPGKHPITQSGHKDATTERKFIQSWWEEHPDANIGVVTGKDSNIFVLDIDPRNGGKESLRQLKSKFGNLPKTVKSRTGGKGLHYFFKYPAGSIKSSNGGKVLGPGIDLKSDGGYVVVPPSHHASGGDYAWINPPGSTMIKAIPSSLKKFILSAVKKSGDKKKKKKPKADNAAISEGQRNNTLLSFAGGMVRQGLTKNAIYAALMQQNTNCCDTPLDKNEVMEIVQSARKYKERHLVIKNPSLLRVQELLTDEFKDGENIIVTPDGSFWVYQGGVWKQQTDAIINHTILGFLKRRPSEGSQNLNAATDETRKLLRTELITDQDIFGFQSQTHSIINCKNGEIWFEDDGPIDFRPHSSKSNLIYQIPIDYDSDAKSPLYDKSVLEIFRDSGAPISMRRHWNELVGYIAQPIRQIPVIPILWGSGANGKTVLSQTLIRLIGIDRVIAARVEELDKNQFLTGDLLGKLLYIDDDVRQGIRLPDGPLKKFSEGKVVTGDRKHKALITFINRALPMLLCNNVPSLNDLSYGMQRRLMVIPFQRSFRKNEDDPKIFQTIWSDEMSGVLNRAIRGWQRLRKRGGFKIPRPVTMAQDRWLVHANPLKAFLDDCVIKDPKSTLWFDDFFESYSNWSKDCGMNYILQKNNLKQKLQDLEFNVKPSSQRRMRIFGMKFRS